MLIYLIRRDNCQNTSYVLILSPFSNCVLLFDTPCIKERCWQNLQSATVIIKQCLKDLVTCECVQGNEMKLGKNK